MTKELDLRKVNIIERHPVLFKNLSRLQKGESLTFINDHEPRPLYSEFARRGFQHDTTKESENKWIIKVTKV